MTTRGLAHHYFTSLADYVRSRISLLGRKLIWAVAGPFFLVVEHSAGVSAWAHRVRVRSCPPVDRRVSREGRRRSDTQSASWWPGIDCAARIPEGVFGTSRLQEPTDTSCVVCLRFVGQPPNAEVERLVDCSLPSHGAPYLGGRGRRHRRTREGHHSIASRSAFNRAGPHSRPQHGRPDRDSWLLKRSRDELARPRPIGAYPGRSYPRLTIGA